MFSLVSRNRSERLFTQRRSYFRRQVRIEVDLRCRSIGRFDKWLPAWIVMNRPEIGIRFDVGKRTHPVIVRNILKIPEGFVGITEPTVHASKSERPGLFLAGYRVQCLHILIGFLDIAQCMMRERESVQPVNFSHLALHTRKRLLRAAGK